MSELVSKKGLYKTLDAINRNAIYNKMYLNNKKTIWRTEVQPFDSMLATTPFWTKRTIIFTITYLTIKSSISLWDDCIPFRNKELEHVGALIFFLVH